MRGVIRVVEEMVGHGIAMLEIGDVELCFQAIEKQLILGEDFGRVFRSIITRNRSADEDRAYAMFVAKRERRNHGARGVAAKAIAAQPKGAGARRAVYGR